MSYKISKKNIEICSFNQRGASLVELSLTLVLMLIFLGGVVILGNLFIQSSWLNQTIYQLTYASSSIGDASGRAIRLQEMANSLVALQKDQFTNKSVTDFQITVKETAIPLSSSAADPSESADSRTVKTLSVEMESHITAPWKDAIHTLGPSASTTVRDTRLLIPEELKWFDNPTPKYDCSGNPCSGSGFCASQCFRCASNSDTTCPTT